MSEPKKLSEEEIIKTVITRYGEVIDLRKTPYLLIEILRAHGRGLDEVPDGGVSVAGVGTPPAPGPSGSIGSLMDRLRRSGQEITSSVIARYGEVIDLRKAPDLILEILRTHGGGVNEVPDAGVSVAGVGTPPGPSGAISSLGNVVDNVQIMKEILKLSKQVATLTEHVLKLSADRQ